MDNLRGDALMDIYFSPSISEAAYDIIHGQARLLAALMSSLEEWRSCRYGSRLDFCDSTSLSLVRDIMEKYATATEETVDAGSPYTNPQRHSSGMKEPGKSDRHVTLSTDGTRSSAAPVESCGEESVTCIRVRPMGKCTLSTRPVYTVNPLISEFRSVEYTLHTTKNPFFGFHLAGNVSVLGAASPSKVNSFLMGGASNTLTTSFLQFRDWAEAYRDLSETGILLRFVVADALSFCHTLQGIIASGYRESSVNLIRRPLDPIPLALDAAKYYHKGLVPMLFDTIDASNITDHVGPLNILAATATLLKDSLRSTLHIESHRPRGSTGMECTCFDELLCGHAPMIPVFLGLDAVECWAGCSSNPLIEVYSATSDELKEGGGKFRIPITFKLHNQLAAAPLLPFPTLRVAPVRLAGLMVKTYMGMFRYKKEAIWEPFRQYHSGSFAILMKTMQSRVMTDWPLFWDFFFERQKTQSETDGTSCYSSELRAQLQLHQVYTRPQRGGQTVPGATAFANWAQLDSAKLPLVVVVTLVVPRKTVMEFLDRHMEGDHPAIEGILRYTHCEGSIKEDRFASVQIAFGRINTHTRPGGEDGMSSITIHRDRHGWLGAADMILSFYVLTESVYTLPGGQLCVGLGVQKSKHNEHFPYYVEKNWAIYTTPLSNEGKVFITRFMPHADSHPVASSLPLSAVGPSSQGQLIGHNDTRASAVSICKPPTLIFHEDEGIRAVNHWVRVRSADNNEVAKYISNITAHTSDHRICLFFDVDGTDAEYTFDCPFALEGCAVRPAERSEDADLGTPGDGFIETTSPVVVPERYFARKGLLPPAMAGEDSVPNLVGIHVVNVDSLPTPSNRLQLNEVAQKSIRPPLHVIAMLHNPRLQEPPNDFDSCFERLVLQFTAKEQPIKLNSVFSFTSAPVGHFLILHTIRIDGPGTLVLDGSWLRTLDQSNPQLQDFAHELFNKFEFSNPKKATNLSEWKDWWIRCTPILAERCRTFTHKPRCPYIAILNWSRTIHLDRRLYESIEYCHCGSGQFSTQLLPAEFKEITGWEEGFKYMTRVAISPLYRVPYEYKPQETMLPPPRPGAEGGKGQCANCKAPKTPSGQSLMRCGNCQGVAYCSTKCQKEHWKKHKRLCDDKKLIRELTIKKDTTTKT